MKYHLWRFLIIPFALFAALFGLLLPKQKKELIWGPIPIINNKYWSNAMRQAGWNSKTLMNYYMFINKREDYDLYSEDLVPKWLGPSLIRRGLASCFALMYIFRNASVVHLSFMGGPLGQTPLWWLEAHLFRWAGIRTIVMPFGADAYIYSQVMDPSVRHGLLLSYPDAARQEFSIAKRVSYWSRYADIILTGIMIDGFGRWDVPMKCIFCIDVEQWQPRLKYSSYDGTNGPVKVIHTPNHRGFKGTEFLIQAVEELKAEGLKIELILLEKVPNDKVRELMQEADILAEQFIIGYALNGIEGMASGLPVLSNLEYEAYISLFRRYSFLNECPIVSTSPETLKQNLRALVINPNLRMELGQAGRQYVEKYHSYESAQYLFGSIYDKILYGKDVDLMNLFHPLKSEYNRKKPLIKHPLIENHLPLEYLKQENSSSNSSNLSVLQERFG